MGDSPPKARSIASTAAHIDYELCIQPYGVKEFGVQDLDDHDIACGQVLE